MIFCRFIMDFKFQMFHYHHDNEDDAVTSARDPLFWITNRRSVRPLSTLPSSRPQS